MCVRHALFLPACCSTRTLDRPANALLGSNNLYGAVPAENYNPGGALAAQRGGNTSAALLNQNEHWMVSF